MGLSQVIRAAPGTELRVACRVVLGRLVYRPVGWSPALVRCLVGWASWGSLGVPASFQAGKLSPGPPCQAA